MNFKTIAVGDAGRVRTITLHRPERRNAMTAEMQMELIAALEEAAAGDCRVLVLAGAGAAFCAGLDLTELSGAQGPAEFRTDAERVARLFLALYELPVPTIAAVHGSAIAGGAGLAILCDFTLATPGAKFGFTEVRIGFVPALVSIFLAMQIGDKRSLDLLLTGRVFSAEEAFRQGLVNEVVPQNELASRVEELARTLMANSPESLRATKRLMTARHRSWLDAAVTDAIEASVKARETADFREGIKAFFEKRPPEWTK